MKRLLILIIWVLAAAGVQAQSFDYETIAPHPRLLMTRGEACAVRDSVAANPVLKGVADRITALCVQTLDQPPVERIKEGKRLLAVSRTALKRIFYLSYTYRMTGDVRYAHRAEAEMRAVCGFTDWNPTHFLDVGEMVMALAIGYDWLYDFLSPDTRKMVRDAIVTKGFKAAENKKHAWFYTATNNWNAVCNSGLTYGALAIFEDEPEVSKAIIEKCLATNPLTMRCYGPDGGYPEGFGYWGYGTSFEVMLIAALESAFGSDCGLSQTVGFLPSARFMQFMTAPSGDCFCFSDAEREAMCNPMMFWFARKLGDESVLWLERRYLEDPKTEFAEDRLLPCLPIFCSKLDMKAIAPPVKHFWRNGGATPVFIYRGGWTNADDTYLAVKGGSASTSHAHMDEGSFIYERNGVRWAMDLGMQSYITLESKGVDLWNGKQDGGRWDVYRLSVKAHNTVVLNDNRHLVAGFAPIVRSFETVRCKGAEVDLTSVLAADAEKAVRRVWLDKNDDLHVTDRIRARKSGDAEVMWIMQTPAEAEIIDAHTIRLRAGGHTALFVVESPSDVALKIWDNIPPHDYDYRNPGTRRVGFTAHLAAGSQVEYKIRLTVEN